MRSPGARRSILALALAAALVVPSALGALASSGAPDHGRCDCGGDACALAGAGSFCPLARANGGRCPGAGGSRGPGLSPRCGCHHGGDEASAAGQPARFAAPPPAVGEPNVGLSLPAPALLPESLPGRSPEPPPPRAARPLAS